MDKFQRDLRDVKSSPEFIEKLKEIMEEIENSMMTFKEQQRKVYVFCLIKSVVIEWLINLSSSSQLSNTVDGAYMLEVKIRFTLNLFYLG